VAALDELMAFDLDESDVKLWAFKGPSGLSAEPPRYSAHWVETTLQVDQVLRGIVSDNRRRINEVIDYALLAQNNEGSALTIPFVETYADRVVQCAAAETNDKRTLTVNHLRNATFYDIKLVSGNRVVHAVRQTDKSWQSRRAISLSTFLFRNAELSLEDSPKFDVDTHIDFLIIGDDILILDKAHFESILRYKATFIEDFADLLTQTDFTDAFVDVAPLANFIGENKLHLRRISAVKQKGHYRDPEFMNRLRAHHRELDLHFDFDEHGKIVVTPETCPEIITALLDHRLNSTFSRAIYDVPSTVRIG
jgi:Domain of unknown function (DUF4868)